MTYDLQLLQVGLTGSVDTPHRSAEGLGDVLDIIHRPLVMSEDNGASLSAKSTGSTCFISSKPTLITVQ
jgi:hypothetical protein